MLLVLRAGRATQTELQYVTALRHLPPGVLFVVANKCDEIGVNGAGFVERRMIAETYLRLHLLRDFVFSYCVPMDEAQRGVTPAATVTFLDEFDEVKVVVMGCCCDRG